MKPIIYQILTRLFSNRNTNRKQNGSLLENGCGKMNEIDTDVLRRIKDMGVSHIWYTGMIRHATQTDYTQYGIPAQHPCIVKGKAGSPYAIADYYDIDPDLAEDVEKRMDEFEGLVCRTHQAGMKVIVDFVPNHVARQYRSVCKPAHVRDLGENDNTSLYFSPNNNFYYIGGSFECPFDERADEGKGIPDSMPRYEECPAKATGNDCFVAHPGIHDWYETVKLNYGVDYYDDGRRTKHFDDMPDTWCQMADILLFWAEKDVDGFRCDMAEMVPAEFWNYAISRVKARYPDVVFIAEVYNPSLYKEYVRAGFDWLYDKVGMYDCLRDVVCDRRPTQHITWQWQDTDDIAAHLLYFLENHDEQRIASSFFSGNARKAVPALMVTAWMRNNPLMLYAGQEFGEPGMDAEGFSGMDGRTSIFDYWCVDSLRRGYYEREQQTEEERRLCEMYRQILTIAASKPVMREGEFFDLMYVNPHLAEKQFVFLRRMEREMALVAVNFSTETVETTVYISSHAFDLYGIREQAVQARELLTGEETVIKLCLNRPVPLVLPAWSGQIWTFTCQ